MSLLFSGGPRAAQLSPYPISSATHKSCASAAGRAPPNSLFLESIPTFNIYGGSINAGLRTDQTGGPTHHSSVEDAEGALEPIISEGRAEANPQHNERVVEGSHRQIKLDIEHPQERQDAECLEKEVVGCSSRLYIESSQRIMRQLYPSY